MAGFVSLGAGYAEPFGCSWGSSPTRAIAGADTDVRHDGLDDEADLSGYRDEAWIGA